MQFAKKRLRSATDHCAHSIGKFIQGLRRICTVDHSARKLIARYCVRDEMLRNRIKSVEEFPSSPPPPQPTLTVVRHLPAKIPCLESSISVRTCHQIRDALLLIRFTTQQILTTLVTAIHHPKRPPSYSSSYLVLPPVGQPRRMCDCCPLIPGLVLHLGQAIRYRTWFMLITAFLCGVMETVGWAARFYSSFHPTNTMAYTIQ